MAIIKCPECGSDVSQHAGSCLKCGFPIENYVKNNLKECIQCGKLIPQNAITCEFCGCNFVEYRKRIEKEERERQIAEAVKAGRIKEFSLYGKSVYIGLVELEEQEEILKYEKQEFDAIINYDECNERIQNYINCVIKKFCNNYTNDTIESADTFMEYCVDFFIDAAQEGCSLVYKEYANKFNNEILQKIGLVSEDTVKKIYMDFSDYFDSLSFLNVFMNQVLEMGYDLQVKSKYRELKKELRGRVVGGGFGISGLAKGMLTASVANATIGVAHSAVNTMLDVHSRLKTERKIINYILNKETRDSLAEYFRHDLEFLKEINSMIYNGILDYLSDSHYAIIRYSNLKDVFKQEKERCNSLEEKKDLVINMMEDMPYYKPLYEYALYEIGDSSIELDAIANYVHIDIAALKKSIISKYAKKIDQKKYGEEYKSLLVKYTTRSGLNLEEKNNAYFIEDLVHERNHSVIENNLKGLKLNTINGLNIAIERLRQVDLEEAQRCIKQYQQQMESIEKKFINAYNDIVVNIDASSQKSIVKAIMFLSAFEGSAIKDKLQELKQIKEKNKNTMITQLNYALKQAKKIEEYKNQEQEIDKKRDAIRDRLEETNYVSEEKMSMILLGLIVGIAIFCIVVFVSSLSSGSIVFSILVTAFLGVTIGCGSFKVLHFAYENGILSLIFERKRTKYYEEELDRLYEQKCEISQKTSDYYLTEECRKCYEFLSARDMNSSLISSIINALESEKIYSIEDGIREYSK